MVFTIAMNKFETPHVEKPHEETATVTEVSMKT